MPHNGLAMITEDIQEDEWSKAHRHRSQCLGAWKAYPQGWGRTPHGAGLKSVGEGPLIKSALGVPYARPPGRRGPRVAVALSFDVDQETLSLRDGKTSPALLAQGEPGSRARSHVS